MAAKSTKFTLRFHDERSHDLLGILADHFGMSKNQLAGQMLDRELQAAALLLENDLTGTLALLRTHRPEQHAAQAIADIAEAEAYVGDPLQTQLDEGGLVVDAFGIAEAFH